MSSDDQYFFDILSSIPNDVKRHSREIAEYTRDIAESIERHFENVAASLRGTIQATPWIPDSIKPPTLYRDRAPPPPLPVGYLERVQDWVSQNRAVAAAIVAFVGTGTFIIWRYRRSNHKKRRARRAANGARTEVVVLAGSPHSPLTRSLSLDLERRGFIVYVPVSTLSEEKLVQGELRADVRPLHLDITSPASTQETLQIFSHHLTSPHYHSTTNNPHTLHLASLIILPPPPNTHPVSAVTFLSPSTWSDTLNSNLLAPFTLLHAFLPLLLSQSQLPPNHPSARYTSPKTSILFLNPSITPPLHQPLHSSESTIAGALTSYITTLRTEVSPHNLAVQRLKLGAFDYSSAPGFTLSKQQHQQIATYNASRLGAEKSVRERERLAREYSPSSPDREMEGWYGGAREAKGSSLRELHNGVFDAITGRRGSNGGVIYLGKGSWAYDFVGTWVPRGVVGWMMGWGKTTRGVGVDVVDMVGDGSAEWERVEGEGEGSDGV